MLLISTGCSWANPSASCCRRRLTRLKWRADPTPSHALCGVSRRWVLQRSCDILNGWRRHPTNISRVICFSFLLIGRCEDDYITDATALSFDVAVSLPVCRSELPTATPESNSMASSESSGWIWIVGRRTSPEDLTSGDSFTANLDGVLTNGFVGDVSTNAIAAVVSRVSSRLR